MCIKRDNRKLFAYFNFTSILDKARPQHLGTTCPTLLDKCVGPLTPPAKHMTLKMQKTGPTVHSPYPRRLERLTICRHNYKGGTFFSVILGP